MINQTNWTEYTGSDEQIAELTNAEHGYLLRWHDGEETERLIKDDYLTVNTYLGVIESYWIIPDDPLRDMKVRQAMTKQPTYIRMPKEAFYKNTYPQLLGDKGLLGAEFFTVITTNPRWDLPNAEYSFTEFKD